MSIDGAGNVTVAGSGDGFAGTQSCWAVRLERGASSWTDQGNIATTSQGIIQCDSGLSIAGAAAGVVVAAWGFRRETGLGVDILGNRYEPGTGWGQHGPVATVQRSCESCPVNLAIAVDALGSNAIAVWRAHDGTRGRIGAVLYR